MKITLSELDLMIILELFKKSNISIEKNKKIASRTYEYFFE